MLRPDDLVGLPDFDIGALTVSPSRRMVERGDRSIAVEPRIMQLLVLLSRERGKVVTRQTLFDEIWGGVPVGDDSLNRAAAGVRKALEFDRDNVELETVPRTGYRLNVRNEVARSTFSRRQLAAGGAAVAALAGASFWAIRSRDSSAFKEQMRKGEDAMAYDERSGVALPFFQRAAELRPDSARAYGLLAYAQVMRRSALANPPEKPDLSRGAQLQKAQGAVATALSLDKKQPDARLAQVILQRSMLDFATTEDRFRAILADDPANVRTMRNLWDLLQCVGRSRDALAQVERALAIAPLSAVTNFPRAQLLWITGRVSEADRVIDAAMDNWPSHPFVKYARYTIFAYTGRARAALAMLDQPATRPANFSDAEVERNRILLTALDQRTPAAINAAVKAAIESSRRRPQGGAQAMMTMAELGRLDEAFAIANRLFVAEDTSPAAPSKGTSWRFTPFLFTPPIRSMWNDPRFTPIADAAGLTDYWSKRGIGPDFRGGRP